MNLLKNINEKKLISTISIENSRTLKYRTFSMEHQFFLLFSAQMLQR